MYVTAITVVVNCSKIVTNVVSDFTAYYFSLLSVKLQSPSSFDGQIVTFPSLESIQDYLRWKQAGCHISNLYNTCFWALLHSGVTFEEAKKKLSVSVRICEPLHLFRIHEKIECGEGLYSQR
jgi:tRNA(His) 5'-end guanylyltransferase